ncbi:MAG: energy transducer TonB [Acetobacteraceae bacterium]
MRRSLLLSLAGHAFLALTLLAASRLLPGRGFKAPPVLAEVELVEQNTPAVGRAPATAQAVPPAARPSPDTAAPSPAHPPPPPPPEPMRRAALLPPPPPPAPAEPPLPESTKLAAHPQPAAPAPPAPSVRLAEPGSVGTGLVSGSQVIPAALDKAAHNAPPGYPPLAVRDGEEGSVILRVHIAADGSATSVEIFRTSGYPLLDQAALRAVGRWHFVPARRVELPVPSTMLGKIRFVLTNPEGGE